VRSRAADHCGEVPPIAANPPAADHITFDRTTRTLHVPD